MTGSPGNWPATLHGRKTARGIDAHERAQGRRQRAFADIDAHRTLQAADAAKGLSAC
jgi:hypothetical protein